MIRPRTLGKIAVGALVAVFVVLALVYSLGVEHAEKAYHVYQGEVFALLAICAALLYRYFED